MTSPLIAVEAVMLSGAVFTNIGGLWHKNLHNFKTFVLPKFWHKSIFTKGYFGKTFVIVFRS